MNTSLGNENLPYLSDPERLSAYQLLTDGCSHIYSKGQLQVEKALKVLETLVPLTQKDPYFLAHLTSYAIRKTENKDLQVFLSYVASISSADGSPFSPGSKYFKPNLRYVSAAAVQELDPKLANRVLQIASLKYSVPNYLNQASHFPSSLRTALTKYLRYREENIQILKGVKKAGLGNTLIRMYRKLHLNPSDQVAAILRWKQKDREIKFEESEFKFEGLTDLEIAKTIREKKLPVLGVLGALPRQVTPVIAVALLEQATGNQAVILRKTFDESGALSDPEVMKLYTEKIASAKTALDRVEVIAENASSAVKKVLKETRAEKRKEELGEIGKLFLFLDKSGSLEEVFDVATKRGAIIAEMVKNPKENFRWGMYDSQGELLPLPEEFVEDAFAAILFGKRAGGSTDAFALYPQAREFGASCDVQISDGGHNVGDLGQKIREYHEQNPNVPKPKVCVIVQVRGSDMDDALKDGYESNEIVVAVMKPETLTESALISSAVKAALVGPLAIIEEIMGTELLKLPEYYFTL